MGDIDSTINIIKDIFDLFSGSFIGNITFILLCILIIAISIFIIYPNIKNGYKEMIIDINNLMKRLKNKVLRKKATFTLIIIVCIVLIAIVSYSQKNSNVSSIEPFYPIAVDMKDITTVGEWTYFIFDVDENIGYSQEIITYPALFRYKGEEDAVRVSPRACYNYQIAENSVFYLDSTLAVQDHGLLYISRPDGKNERLLDEEIYNFQIIDETYIFYIYRHDTVGVGIEGHALYRVNLDGTNKMIAAYEVSGIGLEGSHFDFTVKDEWAYGKNYRIRLGNPANGFEKIELLEECDNDDWIYYVTNRLIKARKDGTEQIELDGVDSYDYQINNIDKEWVYYTKGGERYKIKKDATNKTKLN